MRLEASHIAADVLHPVEDRTVVIPIPKSIVKHFALTCVTFVVNILDVSLNSV